MRITVDCCERHQKITGFGVSGAWWAQEVGGFTENEPGTSLQKREYIAELLFDKEKGIGITQYRYNLGAGSADSGAGKFSNEDRRAHSFETAPGKYDWSRDENAVWMMKAAAKNGADEITLFVNSPIERLTKNHKSHLDSPLRTNLPLKNVKEFADYCLNAAEHFKSEGLPIKYISPVNEPVWVWTGGQEGCHYRPLQVYNVMKVFAEELEKRPALSGVKLSGAENGDIRWFNKCYSAVMCRDKKIRRHIDSVDIHSYFLDGPLQKFPGFIRRPATDRTAFLDRYRRFMEKAFPAVPVKVSEWCHMQGGRDCSINSALAQAKVMAEDLIRLNAAAWQEWVALSYVDYCDGLIYYNRDKSFELTKRYYGFGNFSKFIRPGAVRIGAAANLTDGFVLAFEQKDNIAVVIINLSEKDESCSLNFGKTARQFITSDEYSLTGFEIDTAAFTAPAKSISTVIAEK